jgi:hypothetical protein
MAWGDPNSRDAKAVIRRAHKGMESPARRQVLRRATSTRGSMLWRTTDGWRSDYRLDPAGYNPEPKD